MVIICEQFRSVRPNNYKAIILAGASVQHRYQWSDDQSRVMMMVFINLDEEDIYNKPRAREREELRN